MSEARTLETVDFGTQTPQALGWRALEAGRNHFDFLVGERLVDGDSLHMRLTVRETVNDESTAWNEVDAKSINAGSQFANNTEGKTTTATTFLLDSDDAVHAHGAGRVAPNSNDPQKDPRTWTGAVHRKKTFKIGGVKYVIEAVAACSGVQGIFDRVVSGVIADTWIGQREQQIRAQHALAA
jgi:hypothetical protein